VSNLVIRWQTGELPEADRDAYEQHLLFCPPCLAQNDKARLALAALAAAAAGSPPAELLARLVGQVAGWHEGHGQ
jgi:hypothetical protein